MMYTGEMKLVNEYLDLVRSGTKTQTVRYGIRNIQLGKLELVDPKHDKNRVAVEVNEVSYLRYGNVDDDMAVSDGFKNKEELTKALLKFYPDIDNESEVTVIKFSKS